MHQPSLFDAPMADSRVAVANRNEVYWSTVRPHATQSQLRVMEVLRSMPNGGTIDEVAAAMNKTPNQVSGRFSELRKLGAIWTQGEKRPTREGNPAVVWYAFCTQDSGEKK
jgi:hypothetical protein